jgi:serine/threonine protein kinase
VTNVTPAEDLEGEVLINDWQVVRRLPRSPDTSGGAFSVGYEARKGTDRAFVKALDVNSALGEGGLATTSVLMGGQWSEAELLELCAEAGLSRIVAPLGRGLWVDPNDRGRTPVPYIILEWADGGDLAQAIIASKKLDVPYAFAALHGIAAATQQLHTHRIAHRDIRPSNGLIVGGKTKLADLGHAVDLAARDGGVAEGGMAAYAPPEMLYGKAPRGREAMRAGDLYLLGSLVVSMLACRVPLTTLLVVHLPDDLQPASYDGSFAEIAPFLSEPFDQALTWVEEHLPEACDRDRVMRLVRVLSDPNPENRGYPAERVGSQDRYALRRVVAELEYLRHDSCRRLGA